MAVRQSGQLFANESAVRTLSVDDDRVIAPTVKHPGGLSPAKVK